MEGNLGSITSRCSGNEPTFTPEETGFFSGSKAGPEGAAEIDPRKNHTRSTSLVRVLGMVNKRNAIMLSDSWLGLQVFYLEFSRIICFSQDGR